MKEEKEYTKEKRRLKVQQRIKLEEIIEGGKWNFVLIRGVAMFGGFMFIFFLLFDKFIYGYNLDIIDLNVYAVICVTGGLIFGLWTWKTINKKMKVLKKK